RAVPPKPRAVHAEALPARLARLRRAVGDEGLGARRDLVGAGARQRLARKPRTRDARARMGARLQVEHLAGAQVLQSLPRRRLVTGPAPTPDRILFASIWFRHHNNPRYAELIPRLERLDRYLFELSDRRIPRGLQFRALRYGRRAWHPLV